MPEEVEKRSVGRPSLDPENRRKVSAAMYLTREEHDRFMENAESAGMSISNFMRSQCEQFFVAQVKDEGSESVEEEEAECSE